LDKTLKSELQISVVMDNLGLRNIDISPLKDSILVNYNIERVRKNKEDLENLI